MRNDTARAIATIGASIDPESIRASQDIFRARHEQEPYGDILVIRDARYGEDERNRLDIFWSANDSANQPVVVYVHGGGFVGGDKRSPAGTYYDNIGVWAARHGFVGITMTYRLAPEHKYPAGSADIATAISWLRANVATYGGNPEGIILFGQSAGATHVASYVARQDLHKVPGGGIRAAIMFSGVYDFRLFPLADNLKAYLGDGDDAEAIGSALPALALTTTPLLFGIAELDPPLFHGQAMALANALYNRSHIFPNVLYLPRHNHISQVAHLNAAGSDDGFVTDRLTDFIEANVASVHAGGNNQ